MSPVCYSYSFLLSVHYVISPFVIGLFWHIGGECLPYDMISCVTSLAPILSRDGSRLTSERDLVSLRRMVCDNAYTGM